MVWHGDSEYITCSAKYLNFTKIWTPLKILRNLLLLIFPRNLNMSQNRLAYFLQISCYTSPKLLFFILLSFSTALKTASIYTILQNKRMRWCGVPQPIIFERLKLLQQIIYREKGNLSKSPNQFRYHNNILISRFYK